MKREYHYQTGAGAQTVTLDEQGEGWVVTVAGRTQAITARQGEGGRLMLESGGKQMLTYVARDGSRIWVHVEGQTWFVERIAAARPRRVAADAHTGPLLAAMPGRVLDVLAGVGDSVRKGQTLVLLEAMKMELRISAPADGVVVRVYVAAGQVIERGAQLLEVDTKGNEPA